MRLMQPILELERLYNRYVPGERARFAGSRVIRWGIRHGHMRPPIVEGEESIRLEFIPGEHLDVLLRELELHGSWEPGITALLRTIVPPGGVFMDVGANLGYYSLLASRWVGGSGRVYAFEPLRGTYDRLVRNIGLNGAKNIVPLRMACAASAGDRHMRTFADSGWSHLATDGDEGEAVEATTIDETVERMGVSRLDVIKIDAEGADFEVVKGARRSIEKLRPMVLMEAHHLHRFGASVDAVSAFFEALGYDLEPQGNDYSLDLLATPRERGRALR